VKGDQLLGLTFWVVSYGTDKQPCPIRSPVSPYP